MTTTGPGATNPVHGDMDQCRPVRLPRLAFGGDYNPEQWSPTVWREDVELMRKAGVNLVSVGIFAWSALQPAPDSFEFGWLDQVLDLLHAGGIAVDLGTATANPPPWLLAAHPEVRPVTSYGIRLAAGSRQTFCPSSPVFAEHARRLVGELARRYSDHPALAFWHLSNEYGDHVSSCYCEASTEHFRRFLQHRHGSIEVLNERWGTTHWGQIYRDFAEIDAPRQMPGPANPAQIADFRRFSTQAIIELVELEKAELAAAGPDIPVTTNFMGMCPELDYWALADRLDLITDDSYPDPLDPRAAVRAASSYDLMRSLGGGAPWLLLEQAPSGVSWREVNPAKAPGVQRLWSYQAIARGSDGAMFFQWRAPAVGSELHHSTMLPAAGTDTRIYREICQVGAELSAIGEIAGSRVCSDVAILMDWDVLWALDPDTAGERTMPSALLRWRTLLDPLYQAVFERGFVSDYVRMSTSADQLARYPVLVVPNAYLLSDDTAAGWAQYVSGGGQLLVGPFSGIVDRWHHRYAGGAPGPLREWLGVTSEEPWPLAADEQLTIRFADDDSVATVRIWAEWLTPTGPDTQVLATFVDGPLAGRPAVTRRRVGDGFAWYSSVIEPEGGPIVQRVAAAAGLRATDPGQLETVTRRQSAGPVGNGIADTETFFTFLLNHSGESVVAPAPAGVDLLTGNDTVDAVLLPAYGVAVVRHPARCRPAPAGTDRPSSTR